MLRIESLTVRYDDTTALDGVSLDLEHGGRIAVVGPSGCGKSTLLRAVGGLLPLTGGRISWDGRDLSTVPVHERGFGLMFQDHALFPHRSVAANVGFGLRMRGIAARELTSRVDEMLELVGLGGRGGSRIDQLSGGERQRVALARTLAPAPRLVMLDEPLASLDRVLRTDLLDEMVEIFDRLAVTVVAVTHDLDEAFRLADNLAVMAPRRIDRSGLAADVWDDPATAYTAGFLGYATLAAAPGLEIPTGSLAAVAPGGFRFADDAPITGTVVRRSFERGTWRHVVRVADVETIVETPTPRSGRVTLAIDPSQVRWVQPTSSAV